MAKEPITQQDYQEANSLRTDALQNAELNYWATWLHPVVLAVGQTAPTGTEDDGDRYVVGAGTGDFAGQDDKMAVMRDGVWQFFTPPAAGVPIVKNLDDGSDWEYVGSTWAAKGGGGGTTLGKHAIPIMASGMSPKQAAGCAALAYLTGASGQPDVAYLAFDASTEEHAQFAIPMPKSWNAGTISFEPIWMHPATTTNFGVCFKLRALAVSNDDNVVASFGTAQSSVDTGGTTSDLYAGPESSAITAAGSPAKSDTLLFDLYRDPADGGDTMAVDAYLVGIRVFITTDAETDA